MNRADSMRNTLCAAALWAAAGGAWAQGTTTAFTYQGRLTSSSAPVSGTCAFRFTLWTVPTGDGQMGPQITRSLPVEGGLFATALDFGPDVFLGGNRYLGVSVDCGAGFVALPRQQVTPAPYALTSGNTLGLQGRPVSAAAPESDAVLSWTGTHWEPRPELGDITRVSVDPGSGLVGGALSGEAPLAIDPEIVQVRLQSCPPGSSIRAVDAGGNPTCQTDAAPSILGWEFVNASCTFGGAEGPTTGCTAVANCSAGKRIVGGGAEVLCPGAHLATSYPAPNAQDTWQWRATVLKRSDSNCGAPNGTLNVRAICAQLD